MGFTGNAPAGVGIEQARSEKQTCLDIDECLNPEDNLCDLNAECINLKVLKFFVSLRKCFDFNIPFTRCEVKIFLFKV